MSRSLISAAPLSGLTAVLLALATTVAAPAVSAAGPAPVLARPAPAVAAPSATPTPEQTAAATARATGKKVLVEADTTATGLTYANPDGSFTHSGNVLPVRARKGGSWVPVDATLVANPDGTLSPKAVNGTVAFSRGGSMPLVSTTDTVGHSLALTFPAALPAPVVSGSSATYPEVFPGVDLVVTASTDGGFSEVLVVKSATAAANPALRNLHLGLRAPGLKAATDANGALTVTDPRTGEPAFAAANPVTWDSAAARNSAPGTSPASAATSAASAAASEAAPAADPLAAVTSDATGPGRAAHVSRLGIGVTASAMVLTPDPAALTGPGVKYPVFIDPSLTPTPKTQAWDYVAQSYPTQNYLNGAGSNKDHNNNYVARVGYDDWQSNSNGDTWSYFQIGDLTALRGTDIIDAELQLSTPYYNGSPEASSSGSQYTIYARNTGGITSGTTYNLPAQWKSPTDSAQIGGSAGQAPNINVTDMVKQTVSQGGSSQTLAVYIGSTTTTDHNTYRYLDPNPTIAVTYWHYTGVPTNPTVIAGGTSHACSTDPANPTWIDKTDSGTVSLQVSATDPDVGYPMWGNFSVSANGGAAVAKTSPSITAQSGNNTLTVTGYPVGDGVEYSWSANSTNPVIWSADDAACYFRVDSTSPATKSVTSSDFPQQGGGKVQNQPGTFTLTAEDTGSNPSGINHYAYNLGTSFTGANTAQVAGTAAADTADRWKLIDSTCAHTADDSTGSHPAAVTGGVTCGSPITDTEKAAHTGFSFDGSGSLATGGPVLTTNTDFSVSAWVYLTDTANWNTAVAQAGTDASGFYLQYSPADNRWAMSFNNADVQNPPTSMRALSTAPPQLKTWTHLTATYNASSGVATLYVNGQPQGTVTDKSPFNAPGAFLMGRSQYNASPSDYFHGAIADVQAYQRTLTAAEVSAIYSTTSITATPPNWGTDILWVAAVDSAGNQSQPQKYLFFTPAAPYTPGVTGDLTGDGKPDLAAIDKAGNVRLYSDPRPSDINPPGGTTLDQKYGGSTLLTAQSSPNWQAATFAGALIAHGGSFTGKNVDDLMVLSPTLQSPNFHVFENNGTGTGWTDVPGLAKPTCTVPAGYTYTTCAGVGYSSNWSAVKQMIDVPPSTATGLPGLVTLEESGGKWSVVYYRPGTVAGNPAFSSAVVVSTSDSSWDWGKQTLMYAGDVTGDGKPDLLVREDTGNLGVFSDLESGVNGDAYTARILVGGANGAYTADAYPFVTGSQSNYWGKPAIWAVNAAGTLNTVPITTGTGPALGTSVAVSNTGWGANLVALENSYTPFDNVGTRNNTTTFASGTGFDGTTSYSQQALQTGLTPASTVSLYTDNTLNTPATGLYPDTAIATADDFLFDWPGQTAGAADNYQANGQTIPFPVDLSGNAATSISILGSATGVAQGATGTATVTWSDGTEQQVAITFSDWALGGAAKQTLNPADQLIGSMTTQAAYDGTTPTPPNGVALFEDTIQVKAPSAGVQLASITLPTSTTVPGGTGGGGKIHVFALGSDPGPVAPVHEWKLTEGTGTTAADAIGGVNATLVGAPGSAGWTTDATRGPVLNLDGVSGGATTGTPPLNTAHSFTVSAWVKLSSTTHNAAVLAPAGTSESGFYLGYLTGNGGEWALYFMQADVPDPAWQATVTSTGVTTGWTHLAAVYDASAHTARLYVNGTLAGTATGVTTWNATGGLNLGRDVYNGDFADFLPGDISDAVVYDTALTGVQVNALS